MKISPVIVVLALFCITTLTACGGSDAPSSDTPPEVDTTPNNFNLLSQNDVEVNTIIDSEFVIISGINSSTVININGGEYKINEGEFTKESGYIHNNEKVVVRLYSSNQFSSTVNATLTIGEVKASFEVSTRKADVTPEPFNFPQKEDVDLNTPVESNIIKIIGIEASTNINIVGGEYSINGGSFSNTTRFVNNGDYVIVKLTSPNKQLTASQATLTIGEVSANFSVVTKPIIYFTANNGQNGQELWVTNGNESSTRLVKDINNNKADLSPRFIAEMNGYLYFEGKNSSGNTCLWKYNISTMLYEKVKEVTQDVNLGSISSTTVIGNTLYFIVSTSKKNYLWKSDGSEANTVILNILIADDLSSFITLNENLYFLEHEPTYDRPSAHLKTVNAQGDSKIDLTYSINNNSKLTILDNNLYFSANDGDNGYELWRSNGSEAVMVKDIIKGSDGSNPMHLTVVSDSLFFLTIGVDGWNLWKSNGSEAGTVLIKKINNGAGNLSHPRLIGVGGNLFFFINNGVLGIELWKSDGTEIGTVPIKKIPNIGLNNKVEDLTVVNDILYFTFHDRQLWKTNGTETGTFLLKDFGANSYTRELTAVNDKLYFAVRTGSNDLEIWKSDGTEANTIRLQDIKNEPITSNDFSFIVTGNDIYFSANDEVHSKQLWKSDGSNTTLLTTNDNSSGSLSSYPQNLKYNNGEIYFTLRDDVNGLMLWKSDGTEKNTILVKKLNLNNYERRIFTESMVFFKGDLYFLATPDSYSLELWKSDGTEAGTSLVQLFNPSGANFEYPIPIADRNIPMFTYNNSLYFYASSRLEDWELWKSDGTKAGTVLLKDINPGENGSAYWYKNIITFNNNFYFDAYSQSNHGGLWKSDGTKDGTILIKEFNNINNIVASENNFFFTNRHSSISGTELWKSDGTEDGTILVRSNFPNQASIYILIAINNTVYFSVGNNLWKSDGTESGTLFVKNFDSYRLTLDKYAVINNTLYFLLPAYKGEYTALWKSDGTEFGTRTIKRFSSNEVDNLTSVGNNLYFAASDGSHGKELWKSDGTEIGTVLVKDINKGSKDSNPEHIIINDKIYF